MWRLCCLYSSSVTSARSTNSPLPPQLWVFWASSDKKRRWSWTPVARCPPWWWIWLNVPHSGWWRTGRRLCHDTKSSFTAIWSEVWLFFNVHSPPELSCFCSPSAPCTYTWVTTCGYPKKELQHLIFGLSCISSLLEEGQFLDSRQRYVRRGWAQVELELEGLCPAFCPKKALQVFVLSLMVSIL